ncbi:1-acyl-sn-glycerol-3-phosphate acyltransferase [Actinobacteria bacterium YIM 96077]|uniref:1-acyl-sn-glycerol-3-phosphate acyltransferase n=1 Tax=Phytoactinopolyspora halophila TaxID=1981511 RepID=A0A329QZJ1_9ACTN|nr:lysophospholipid acyltransferase family protein [Phytoactinopolyspora halophila]AYY13228.1 1-acyl-sn-glycerol-3-phosphate acyltransferase [Actinobacteria bacterium YIM 96077]RAW17533.1 1-acyl-sn-glycerol-3-phosphate acyltransferase [Phytoactinopolyspora halophila]
MSAASPVPGRRGAAVGRRLAGMLARLAWSVNCHGSEHVPASGPVILAPNHTGFMDAPLLVATSPRPVHTLAKKELFRGPVGWVLRAVGQIPLDRDGPGRDLLEAGLGVLEDERVLVVFPEGTRGAGDFQDLRTGLAWFALRSGAPVVPVVFGGTGRRGRTLGAIPRFRERLDVVFGQPITLSADGRRGKAALEAATSHLRTELVAHHESAQAMLRGSGTGPW